MTASSAILQVNPRFPIDPTTLHILKTIDETLRSGQIPYMLVGATARDLMLHHTHGLNITRATYDLDFGISVESWEQFEQAKTLLLAVPGFRDKGREAQRLYYTPAGMTFETIIDIIPFGALETETGLIEWPTESDTVMNVVAFRDVFENRLSIQIAPDLAVPIASLPGLVVLKLFAWLDRRNDKDVDDILKLLETYEAAGNDLRLHDQEPEELQRVGYDMELAGAYLLGKDARDLMSIGTREQLSTGFPGERKDQLVQTSIRIKSTFDDHTDRVTALFESFSRGLGG